jgi:hypothetical protein
LGSNAGDTDLPNSTAAVGSAAAGMVSSTVHAAGTALRGQLVGLAITDESSPLLGVADADVEHRISPAQRSLAQVRPRGGAAAMRASQRRAGRSAR